MAKAAGIDAFVGFAWDSAWGTFVGGKLYTRQLVKEDIHLEKPRIWDDFLNGTRLPFEPVEGTNFVQGSMTFKNCFNGIEYPLYHILNGTASGATPTLSETNHVGTWVYTIGTTIPTVGLSISMNRVLKLFQYAGCYIPSVEFKFVSGQPGETTFTVIGKSEATTTVESAAAKTFNTYTPLLATQGAITWGSSTICPYIKEATIKVEGPLSEPVSSLCSTTMIQPVPAGRVKVSGSMTGWYDNTATHGTIAGLYDPFVASPYVPMDASFVWTGGTAYGSTAYSQTIALKSIVLGPTGTPTAVGPGLLECTWPFECFYDGTDTPITITLVNTDTTTLS